MIKELQVIASTSNIDLLDTENLAEDDKDIIINDLKARLVQVNKTALTAIRLLRRSQLPTNKEINNIISGLESTVQELNSTTEVKKYLYSQFTYDKMIELMEEGNLFYAIVDYLQQCSKDYGFEPSEYWRIDIPIRSSLTDEELEQLTEDINV